MLRYSHRMSDEFQKAFLTALEQNGIQLPVHWRSTVHLLNLVSLVDLLKRSDLKNHPNRYADINQLIDYILSELNVTTVGE